MMRVLSLCVLCLTLTACALQDEIILEEPIVEEELADIAPTDCTMGDDDGIGGTGCEPVARSVWRPGP